MIVSLDTRQMNRILALEPDNLTVRVEAGVVAANLERELRKVGYSLGWGAEHYEFSTVGSLAARRSTGRMFADYDFGNSIIDAKIVTPAGNHRKESY
jgi:alkyldihydroxyacetonephosphate synthase